MRAKEDIVREVESGWSNSSNHNTSIIIELLLDIRELMLKGGKKK